jgi:hypothetical protein
LNFFLRYKFLLRVIIFYPYDLLHFHALLTFTIAVNYLFAFAIPAVLKVFTFFIYTPTAIGHAFPQTILLFSVPVTFANEFSFVLWFLQNLEFFCFAMWFFKVRSQ